MPDVGVSQRQRVREVGQVGLVSVVSVPQRRRRRRRRRVGGGGGGGGGGSGTQGGAPRLLGRRRAIPVARPQGVAVVGRPSQVHQKHPVALLLLQEVADAAVAVAAGAVVLLGVVVRVVEGPGTHPLDVVPHVPIEDGDKLEKRLRARWELQAAARVWVRRALEAKPPSNTKMDLQRQQQASERGATSLREIYIYKLMILFYHNLFFSF